MGDLLAEEVDHFDGAEDGDLALGVYSGAIPYPGFPVTNDDHPVGTSAIVGTGSRFVARLLAGELPCSKLNQHRVAEGINDIDRIVRAVRQYIEPDHRINEADVEGLYFLPVRKRDGRGHLEDLVGRRGRRGTEQ